LCLRIKSPFFTGGKGTAIFVPIELKSSYVSIHMILGRALAFKADNFSLTGPIPVLSFRHSR